MRALPNRPKETWSRREWLGAAATMGAGLAAGSSWSTRAWSGPRFATNPFTLGVASGEPSSDDVVLWTRLAPDPLGDGGMPARSVDVDWEIALDESMRRTVRRGTARAFVELGHAVHVEPGGLEPATEYWYRFTAGNARSPVGRTRTAPAPDASPERVRLGVCGCSHYAHGHFTAYRHMAEERFDAIFHTGDYIYEYGAGATRTVPERHHFGAETFTLEDYRRRYAQYRLDPDLQAAHASAPFVVTWDDHEVDNNWAGTHAETGTPPEIFALRRAAAFQAYYEAMPLARRSFPGADGLRLYRQIRFGNLLALNALDTRQYRSRQIYHDRAAPDGLPFDDPRRSLLGARQEAWLDERLAGSDVRWNAIAQQVPFFGRGGTPSTSSYAMDRWPGYPAAHERLRESLAARTPGNAVLLSGDIHSHWAVNLPRVPAEPEGRSLAVEFVTTSISTGGDGGDVARYWPFIRDRYPNVVHHGNRRGYLACTITPRLWRTDHRQVEWVSSPGGRLLEGARVTIERGEPIAHAS